MHPEPSSTCTSGGHLCDQGMCAPATCTNGAACASATLTEPSLSPPAGPPSRKVGDCCTKRSSLAAKTARSFPPPPHQAEARGTSLLHSLRATAESPAVRGRPWLTLQRGHVSEGPAPGDRGQRLLLPREPETQCAWLNTALQKKGTRLLQFWNFRKTLI